MIAVTERTGDALVFEGIGRARVRTLRFPPPPPGMLRVAIQACGVCEREWNVLSGRVPRRFPVVMGHEPVGVIDAIGDGVEGFAVGQHVTGIGTSSLAAYDIVDARHVAVIDAGSSVELKLGEPAMCAVNAVNRISFGPAPAVIVNGVGFMGSLLVQALRAKVAHSTIFAVDPIGSRRKAALEDGADGAHTCLSAALTALGRQADVVFEASGADGTVSKATSAVRNGGTLALFAHHFKVEPNAVNDWHLRGIMVANTVPWSAPDLSAEVREGVALLSCGVLSVRKSGLEIVSPQQAAIVLSAAHRRPRTKLIVVFNESL